MYFMYRSKIINFIIKIKDLSFTLHDDKWVIVIKRIVTVAKWLKKRINTKK
jgi:hypothetical protein